MIRLCVMLFISLFSLTSQGEMVDTYQFQRPEDRPRAVALAKSLRCPQCQNQNLVESNSPIAYDLRLEVYRMIDEGKTDEQIIQRMTKRFGNFVLYQPPFQWSTALLWLCPLLLLLLGISLMIYQIKYKQRKIKTSLDPQQHLALQQLLAKQERDK